MHKLVTKKPVNHAKFWLNPAVILLGSFLLFSISQFVAVLAIVAFGFNGASMNPLSLILLSVVNLVTVVGVLSIVLRISGWSWASIGINSVSLRKMKYFIPTAVVYVLCSVALTALAIKFLPGFDVEEAQDIGIKSVESWPSIILAFFALVVFTPLAEELVFRGVMFRGLLKRIPPWLAAVASSAIFAWLHGQWNVGIDTFAMGLAACYLVKKTNSIFPSIVLHALKNGVAFTLLFLVPFIRH